MPGEPRRSVGRGAGTPPAAHPAAPTDGRLTGVWCALVRPTFQPRDPGANAGGRSGSEIPPNEAAQESNLPTDGLHRPAGFEDPMGHRAPAAPRRAVYGLGASHAALLRLRVSLHAVLGAPADAVAGL